MTKSHFELVIWQNLVVRDNDGRKLDHATLEVLRMRAVEQVGAGAHPEDVAAALRMHRKTVYGWLAKYREGGKELLRARGWQLAARRPWDLPFAEWVPDVHDHLARWALWSRGRGVVSHETALAVHSIGEFESPHVHLTVPPGFTMRNDAVTLHYTRPPRLSQDPRRRRTTGTRRHPQHRGLRPRARRPQEQGRRLRDLASHTFNLRALDLLGLMTTSHFDNVQ